MILKNWRLAGKNYFAWELTGHNRNPKKSNYDRQWITHKVENGSGYKLLHPPFLLIKSDVWFSRTQLSRVFGKVLIYKFAIEVDPSPYKYIIELDSNAKLSLFTRIPKFKQNEKTRAFDGPVN